MDNKENLEDANNDCLHVELYSTWKRKSLPIRQVTPRSQKQNPKRCRKLRPILQRKDLEVRSTEIYLSWHAQRMERETLYFRVVYAKPDAECTYLYLLLD